MRTYKLILIAFSIFFSKQCIAQLPVGSTTLDTTVLANNLSTPWDMVYTNSDTSLWFTERIGKVTRIDLNTNQVRLVLDLQDTVEQFGEGGLLGMEIIETTAIPKVFLVYNYRTSNRTLFERLVRFDYDPNQDSLINETVLLDSIPAAVNHNGSRLEIVNNQLFMTTGDAANTSLPQNINSLAGKVLRLELNGSIPNDNPIANSPVYSWGHRNPQGLFFANGFLYSSEHGPNTDDEINIIEKGGNYGWPDVKGFCNTSSEITFCNDSNVVEPLFAWTPTVATSGICFYDHPAIPAWEGHLLLTTLKDERVIQLSLNAAKDSITSTTDFFTNRWGRLRDITSDPEGSVYIATNSFPQQIIKLYNATYTSIEEKNTPSEAIRIFPNPTINQLTIEINTSKKLNYQLNIYDIKGRKVLFQNDLHKTLQLDVNKLPNGIYFVELINNEGIKKVEKIIIE